MASAVSARPRLRSWPNTLASRLNCPSNGTVERLAPDVSAEVLGERLNRLWDSTNGRAAGGVSAVGKPGTASQFQRRELVAVPVLRRVSTIQPVARA